MRRTAQRPTTQRARPAPAPGGEGGRAVCSARAAFVLGRCPVRGRASRTWHSGSSCHRPPPGHREQPPGAKAAPTPTAARRAIRALGRGAAERRGEPARVRDLRAGGGRGPCGPSGRRAGRRAPAPAGRTRRPALRPAPTSPRRRPAPVAGPDRAAGGRAGPGTTRSATSGRAGRVPALVAGGRTGGSRSRGPSRRWTRRRRARSAPRAGRDAAGERQRPQPPTRVFAGLEADGPIARRPDTGDRRQSVLTLTPAARRWSGT